mmetsp:Transcript_13927/g.13509  ORF Transcript_13927/g.13509 Transcript_13927/m.13509 type:complete len:112 (+) Transcript_13927:843-1178(+)
MYTNDMPNDNDNGVFDIEDDELSDDDIKAMSSHPTQVPTQPNSHPHNTLPPLETINETEERDSVSELPTQTSTPPNPYESDDAWVDAVYATHQNMRRHTGGTMSFGTGVCF